MNSIESRLHRLSVNQLRALKEIAEAPNGVISSTQSGDKIGLTGKSLGGVFSSLARQSVRKQSLILPWGKSEDGRGLRWKLNDSIVSASEVLEVINRLLQY